MEQKEEQPVIISSNGKVQTKIVSYLTKDNVERLMGMFETENEYKYYMRCLWILRDLASKSCEINTPNGWSLNANAKAYPIYKMTNDFISCLLQDKWHFDSNGNWYKMQ